MTDFTQLLGKAWLPIRYFEANLYAELGVSIEEQSRNPEDVRFFSNIPYREVFPQNVFWSQCCFEKPFIAQFKSISEAAEVLRSVQRNWTLYPTTLFRRAKLIEERLPFISRKPRRFPYAVPDLPMGVWTLLDERTLLASAVTSSPFPLGQIFFQEDKINPPSRAYLKLWEAMTLLEFYRKKTIAEKGFEAEGWALPDAGSRCLDAGACPGGWSWVLTQMGAEVVAIDRSELADSLMQNPKVQFIPHDAFTITPQKLGRFDWICCDVICYPPRLLDWIHTWLASGLCENFICTIKMQGEPDFRSTRAFACIPHSKVVHLTANKHELTWLHAPWL